MKKCNLKGYVHLIFYMDEHFDVVINPFKYNCETCQGFIHPFQKFWWTWIYLIMNLTHSKWMIEVMCINICKGGRGHDEMKLFPSRQPFRPSLHPQWMDVTNCLLLPRWGGTAEEPRGAGAETEEADYIHPIIHQSKFLIPEEEDDGRGGGRMAVVYPNVYMIQSCSLWKTLVVLQFAKS